MWLIISNIPFSCDKFVIPFLIWKKQLLQSIFLRFHCLYYSVMFTESKEKFKIVSSCFSTIKDIVTPFSYYYFAIKLIYWGILAFFCLYKPIPINLQFFWWYNILMVLLQYHCFLAFWYFFISFLFVFMGCSRNDLFLINALIFPPIAYNIYQNNSYQENHHYR